MSSRAFVGTLAKGIEVPATGIMVGADDAAPDQNFIGKYGIETLTGRKMAIWNTHLGAATVTPQVIAAKIKAAVDHGSIPMLSFQGAGWKGPAGNYDWWWTSAGQTQIRAIAKAVAAAGTGVLVRWLMEMNGAHNPYFGDPASYRKLWGQMRTALVRATPNAPMIFCPQEYDPKHVWPLYVPYAADGSVDAEIVACDHYRNTFDSTAPFTSFADAHHRLFMVGESGYQQGAIVRGPNRIQYDKDGQKTGHSLILRNMVQARLNANVFAWVLWTQVGPVGDDRIQTSQASIDQHKQWLTSPEWLVGNH